MRPNPPTLVISSLLLVALVVTSVAAVTAAPTASIESTTAPDTIQQRSLTQANENPTVKFTYSPSKPTVDHEVTFEANASDPDGEIVEYEWTVDGTVVATQSNPEYTHTFSSSGDHQVTVTVTDDDGATATKTKTVTVRENQPPDARGILVDPEEPTVNETVEFIANAGDSDGEIVQYEWRVDGTTVATRSNDGFSYNFSSAGNHSVRVFVTDDDGATDNALKIVRVLKTKPPTASIDYAPENPTVGETVSFAADASDPDGSIDSYQWEIDGTTVSTSRTHSHAFETSGEHEVTLTVTDDEDASTTTSVTVNVSAPAAPEFTATIDATSSPVDEGEELRVTTTITNQGGKTGTQDVTLSVGGATRDTRTVTLSSGAQTTLDLRWATEDGDAGTYQARVTTANDSAAREVEVLATTPANRAPSASIDYSPKMPGPNDSVRFVANATDPDGTLERYQWQVDGENVSTDEATTYTFSSSGEHEVTLTVTDDDGATATATRVVTVNAPPSVDVSSSTTSPTVGDTVTFTANVEDDGAIERYRWFVNGEEVGTGPKLNTSFDDAGEYEVTLEVTDDDGAVSSRTRTVEVASASQTPNGGGGVDLPGLDQPVFVVLALIVVAVVAAGIGARFLS